MNLSSRRATTLRATIAGGAAVALAAAAFPTSATADANNNTSRKLQQAVTVDGVMEHLEAFQEIADANGGTRASGTPGYAASRDYVVGKLRAAGYSPTVQEFDFPFYRQNGTAVFEQTAPTTQSWVDGEDFALMSYSGSGDVTAPVQGVDLNLANLAASTSGCEAGDFAGFTAGNIALVRRGGCTFGTKVVNAQTAGASAVIVMNTGTPGSTEAFGGTLGAPVGTVPSLGTSFAIGQSLATTAGAVVHVAADTESEMRKTYNVLAETRGGDDENVVMAGAHLDSVISGAGINDNGSGSAGVLEVAEQMAKVKPKNKVRFAWWGAEELGLLGSEHYVADLVENDETALEAIALYLNFDMIGSPNYSLFVYDGDNSAYPVGPGAAAGPEGSAQIEQMFHDHFASVGLPSVQTPFSGRSDYGPFIAEGIPAGGLFTGAEGVKTQLQEDLFGGEAGVAFDSCYHAECDDIDNVSRDAVDANSDAIAHAVITYAMSTRSVNGSGKGHPASPPGQHEDGVPHDAPTDEGGGLHDHVHDLPSS